MYGKPLKGYVAEVNRKARQATERGMTDKSREEERKEDEISMKEMKMRITGQTSK